MKPELGIIEGFYGPAWSWQERRQLVSALAPAGYGFYLYAPKSDALLRRRWQQAYPPAMADEIRAFSGFCRQQGVRFGVGLSPYALFRHFGREERAALETKLAQLDGLGIETLALLFDDMDGDAPELARRQAEIARVVADQGPDRQLIVCPSYYSEDPVLDRVFGQRPEAYLETLGRLLDPAIQLFWTGEEVCAREIAPGHLRRVGELLGRKPLLWDNYPVNDGPRMSAHLHLRAFTGRPAANGAHLAGHAINPALQPTLTQVPALTLADSYDQGEDYEYTRAWWSAATRVMGEPLAERVLADLLLLEDAGLNRLDDPQKARLRQLYSEYDHPAAREILAWLAGDYRVSAEQVRTQ